jgi:hypothetical protein
MAALDTIYSGVIAKTARPDRIKETKQAVVDAVLEYHSLSYFERDIKTGVATIGARQNGIVLLKDLIPDLRKVLGVFSIHGQKIDKISISDTSRPGYYIVGGALHLHPSNLAGQIKLAFCTKPDIATSWITLEYPEAVMSLAGAKVAAIVGNRNLASALFLEVGQIFPTRSGFKHKIMMENTSYEPDL